MIQLIVNAFVEKKRRQEQSSKSLYASSDHEKWKLSMKELTAPISWKPF